MQGMNICVNYINYIASYIATVCYMFIVHSTLQLLTLLYCTAEEVDRLVATKDTHSENVVQYCTPDKASIEFGLLLNDIIMELEKNESSNLNRLKTISSTLTIQKKSKVLVFNDRELEEIQACNDIRTILTQKLRHCYRWDDCSMLHILMRSVNSKGCLSLLRNFEIKVNSKIKLQQIYEYCKEKDFEFSEQCHKIVAIVDDKIFSDITLEEYHVLKCFVSEHCGVENYVISPFSKGSSSSLVLEWHIPVTAVDHMIKMASNNEENFIKNCFVYLKISSSVILDHRDMVRTCNLDRGSPKLVCL